MGEWIDIKSRKPFKDGRYKTKFRDWVHGSVYAEGEDVQHFENGDFSMTPYEEAGLCYREITHWAVQN